ncbi:MAG: NADH:ubiquinone reductase (Na(+)-transporting) subunit C [Paludibacteraceae bacterium]|nr:NADH:ubiquinone reductase (Na(+)-transporting) subunit C [Paludibacteraceae bacterium]
MNTNSNVYTIVYASIMVIVVAFVLAFFSGSLKEKQDLNVNLDKKKQILYALNLDLTNQDLASVYSKYITQELIVNVDGEVVERTGGFEIDLKTELLKENPADRKLPVYECNVDGETKYIFPLYGAGLWGPIWGYIALNHDKNTVYGVYFSHAGETPGLGAEITTHPFQMQFQNKEVKNAANELVSIAIVKPGKKAEGQDYVDGISGGTITSHGVELMLKNTLVNYTSFLNK